MGEDTKPNKIQSLPLWSSATSDDVLVMMYVSHSEKETKSIAYKSFTEGYLTQQVQAMREVRESFQGMCNLPDINFIWTLSAMKESLFPIFIDMFQVTLLHILSKRNHILTIQFKVVKTRD